MSSQLPNVALSCLLIGCLSYVQAELKALTPNLAIGVIEASDGPVPLCWTIVNNGSGLLRLVCIDNNNPSVSASLGVGSLAPGASTNIYGSFNPRYAVGPINGTLRVIAEYGSAVDLNFQVEVKADIVPSTTLSTVINNINSNTPMTTGKPLTFITESGVSFVPAKISISGEPFVGAHLIVNNDQLELIPYIHEPSLPNRQAGHAVLKICFKHDIGALTYAIPIAWERADPLCITKLGPDTYAVSYVDNYKFKIEKLTFAPGLTYVTRFNNNGTVLILKPKSKTLRRHKVIAIKRHLPTKTKFLKCRSVIGIAKPSIKLTHNKLSVMPAHDRSNYNVLIQLETTHPYCPKVVIRSEKP